MSSKLSRYFTVEEMRCKCGCGYCDPAPLLLSMLDTARQLYGKPIYLTSACRCKLHNALSGGSATSSHMDGMAVDIRCSNDADRFLLLEALWTAGFQRIGVRKDFIHVDIDHRKNAERLWLY